ncbi:MAG TPA: CheR family methyltransferase [Kofleriaceae bacterium]|nr:CheR family methyltransferase [Kofleriaceae bacterium]
MKLGAFFREPEHFAILADRLLPEMTSQPGRTGVRLWVAGCFAGEEAWSLAMVVAEAALPPSWDVKILATEQNHDLLEWTRNAVYYEGRMWAVSPERRARHFIRGQGARDGLWRVIAPLRDRVELFALDLEEPWPMSGRFDVIVCHRALAELPVDRAARLVCRFGDAVAPGGAMFLGPSQWQPTSLAGFELYGRAAYRKLP